MTGHFDACDPAVADDLARAGADDERFRMTYLRTLGRLHEVGARRTLEELVARADS